MNPFPDPETVSPEINKEIKELIQEMIKNKSLDFHTMLSYTQTTFEKKEKPRALICGYYCVNVINSSKFSNNEKQELITGLVHEFSNNFIDVDSSL